MEAANGDILEAIIALEKEGKTARQTGAYRTTGAYSANGGANGYGTPGGYGAGSGAAAAGMGNGAQGGYGAQGDPSAFAGQTDRDARSGGTAPKTEPSNFSATMKRIWEFILRVFHKGNTNHFEVYRHDVNVLSIPVTILVVALMFFFWITLPVLIIALFFGCRYRFRGPDLGRDNINNVMSSAADTAEDIKNSVKKAGDGEDRTP
jgi:hypothetical protein